MKRSRNGVCPVERAGSLDSKLRKWLQNPRKILSPYIKEGMTVLDVGCGPGFFSIETAKMVGTGGKVISADLQEGMLLELANKIRGTEMERIIKLVQCAKDSINVSDRVDFILAFYMVHEVPDKSSLFRQLKEVLNVDGKILLVEPKLFHVSREEFESTTTLAESIGFNVHRGPRLPFSWSAVLMNA